MGSLESEVAEPEWIKDPHTAVLNAMEIWRTGLAIKGAILAGLVTRENFPPRVLLDLGDNRGMPIPTHFDPGQLERSAINLENATLATAVIAADSALDAHFADLSPGSGRPLDRGDRRSIGDLEGVDAVRALLYMIRNAFAHDPFNPLWEVRSSNRIGILRIEDLDITIDTSTLHGTGLHSDLWGGHWGFLQILQLVERELRPSGWNPDTLLERYSGLKGRKNQ